MFREGAPSQPLSSSSMKGIVSGGVNGKRVIGRGSYGLRCRYQIPLSGGRHKAVSGCCLQSGVDACPPRRG